MLHKHTHMCCWLTVDFPACLAQLFFFFFFFFFALPRTVGDLFGAAELLPHSCPCVAPGCVQLGQERLTLGRRKKTWHCPLGPVVDKNIIVFLREPVCVPVVRSNYHSPGFRVYDFGDVAFRLFITLGTVIVKKNNELLTFLLCQVCRLLYLYSIHDGRSV